MTKKIKSNFTHLAKQIMGGVVQIHVEGNLEEDIQSVMNPAIKIPGSWSGSGFFIKYKNLEGYIVTNAHVARNAVKLKISSMLTSEERFEAEVVGLVKQLEPGTTTKDDVILLLPEPTYVEHGSYSDDEVGDFEKYFCYRWIRKDGYYVGAGGGGGTHEVQHSFCLEFTPDGKLKRFKHFERGDFNFAGKKEIPEQERDWMAEEN